jgi:uncharacterized protein (TIGR00255 family)
MTGYGSATSASEGYKVTVELKSLNSKYLEMIVKLPRVYMKYESKVRNLLSKHLERGKIVMLLNVEVLSADKRTLNINQALVQKYKQELEELANFLQIESRLDLGLLLQLPEVLPTEIEEEDPEEWALVESALETATKQLVISRKEEGNALDADLSIRIVNIRTNLEEVKILAPKRMEGIRARIGQSLEDIRHKVELDANRFEQELVFYLEKYDINEEVVRLTQHLEFFEELRNNKKSNGKQLQFLSQEMGREINTIGSKANDASIQRMVVGMKEELDKIKEQVMNIL